MTSTVDSSAHAAPEGLAVDRHQFARFRVTSVSAVRWLGRRRMLSIAGVAGLMAALAACSKDSSGTTSAPSTSPATSPTSTTSPPATPAGSAIPDETAGPFPGDGTNGPNALTTDGVVRADIRKSFGSATATAAGVETNISLTVVDAATGSPMAGAAVYIWHCDQSGRYSMYDSAVAGENYLRGVQVADDRGRLSFVTAFPGCYPGRWPHAHFEVYSDLVAASSGRQAVKTSQMAFPKDACEAVYVTDGYGTSLTALAATSLERDMVFSDGVSEQMLSMSGDVGTSYDGSLVVRI